MGAVGSADMGRVVLGSRRRIYVASRVEFRWTIYGNEIYDRWSDVVNSELVEAHDGATKAIGRSASSVWTAISRLASDITHSLLSLNSPTLLRHVACSILILSFTGLFGFSSFVSDQSPIPSTHARNAIVQSILHDNRSYAPRILPQHSTPSRTSSCRFPNVRFLMFYITSFVSFRFASTVSSDLG